MKKYIAFLMSVIVLAALTASSDAEDAVSGKIKTLDEGYTVYKNDFEGECDLFASKAEKVCAPVLPQIHNSCIMVPVRTDETGFAGTKYALLNSFSGEKAITAARVEFDVLLTKKTPVSVRILDTQKNGATVMSFGKNSLYLHENNATNTQNLKKYENYSENVWYKIVLYIDIKNAVFDMYINNDMITENTSLRADKESLKDFMHWRLAIGKGTEEGGVYIDNLSYKIPLSCVYEKNKIRKEYTDGGEVVFSCLTDSGSEGVMPIAVYENSRLLKMMYAKKTNVLDDVLFKSDALGLSLGQSAKGFILESLKSLTPISKAESEILPDEKDCAMLIEKWRSYYSFVPDGWENDSDVKNRLNIIKAQSLSAQNTMNREETAQSLWGEGVINSSHRMTYSYELIHKMALAWATEGQELYHSNSLRKDIIYALSWMHENVYSFALKSQTGWQAFSENDWWDWFVGTPRFILDTIVLLGDVDKAQTDRWLSPYEYLSEFIRTDLSYEANVNSRAYNAFLCGLLKGDILKIRKITSAYPVLFQFVENGTGMYEDYSYIKHNMIAYNGFYGTGALLERAVKVIAITQGTALAQDEMYIEKVVQILKNAFEPFMVNGGIMNMVRGRGTDRSEEYADACSVYAAAIDFSDFADESTKAYLASFLKTQLTGAAYDYAIENLTPFQIVKLKKLLSENVNSKEYNISRVYNHMDRIVHHRPEFSAGLSMSSERTATYESLDDCNKKGWYIGDGMLYIYNRNEENPYGTDYFKYANPYKRPGTTVEDVKRVEENIPYGSEHFPAQDYVGGVNAEGRYSVGAMSLESFGGAEKCDLTAKKAWFFFDDEIVCLGTDINSTTGSSVYTTVENRKLHLSDPAPEIDGSKAYMSGFGGCYFPKEQNVKSNIKQCDNMKFCEIWIEHGIAPKDKEYSYVLLPGATKEKIYEYAEKPDIEISENTKVLQAVEEKTLGITGVVFWKAGKYQNISTDTPLLMITEETKDGYKLFVSDPTHKKQSVVITVDGLFKAEGESDGFSVKTNEKSTRLTVDLTKTIAGSYGITLKRQVD